MLVRCRIVRIIWGQCRLPVVRLAGKMNSILISFRMLPFFCSATKNPCIFDDMIGIILRHGASAAWLLLYTSIINSRLICWVLLNFKRKAVLFFFEWHGAVYNRFQLIHTILHHIFINGFTNCFILKIYNTSSC